MAVSERRRGHVLVGQRDERLDRLAQGGVVLGLRWRGAVALPVRELLDGALRLAERFEVRVEPRRFGLSHRCLEPRALRADEVQDPPALAQQFGAASRRRS
jgi:hypothetical protein